MHEHLVFSSQDVTPFSPSDALGAYTSRLLVDEESVGATGFVANRFTLHPGGETELGQHPAPFDELYYVIQGEGILTLGREREEYPIAVHSVAFIPYDTPHSLRNPTLSDLEVLTVMPGQLVEGANPLYDARKQAWGQTFRRSVRG